MLCFFQNNQANEIQSSVEEAKLYDKAENLKKSIFL